MSAQLVNSSEYAPSFACDVNFVFGLKTLFGANCFAPLGSMYQNFTADDQIPTCDEFCAKYHSKQPSYNQFVSLNRTRLRSRCSSGKI